MRRRWLVVRYRAGAGPYTVSRHWTYGGAHRALWYWRDWNAASDDPRRALIEYQIARRTR